MQKTEFLNRWLRPAGMSMAAGMIVLALSACQPIQPIQESPAKASTNEAQVTTTKDATTKDAAAKDAVTKDAAQTDSKSKPAEKAAEQPASGDTSKSAELVTEGRSLLKQSDLQGAESTFQDAIDADPANLDALVGLADVYLLMPEYHQQALETAEAAVELAPDSAEALARLSWAQAGLHKFEDARASAEKAVELGSDSAAAHAALADILYAMYENDAAYEAAQKAVAIDDQDAGAWGSLGAIEFGQENWQAAGEDYARALELEPDFFLWQIMNARYELDTVGDADAAREIAQPAIDALPKHAYVISLLVDLAVEQNDWKAAEAGCEDAISLSTADTPYPDGYTCMVAIKLLQEQYKEAEKYQEQAEELAWAERRDISVYRMRLFNDKNQCDDGLKLAQDWLKERSFSVSALRMIGAGYLCKDDYEKAIDYFKQAVEKLPLSLADARLLANAYARDGQESKALATVRKFSKISASNPLYYQALYEVYLFLGKPKDAVKQAQRWQVLRPNSTDAKTSLALGFLFDNNPGAAKDNAEEALDAGASDSTIYAILGESYHRAGDVEKGEEYLKKALEINDDNFLAHNYLATLYLFQGDCNNATEQLKWIKEKTTDEEQIAQIDELLANCDQIVQGGGNQSEGGSDSSGSDNGSGSSGNDSGSSNSPSKRDEAQAQAERDAMSSVRNFLKSQKDARVRTVRFEETDNGLTLVVNYTTRLEAGSDEYLELENKIAYGLASLLPDLEAKPVELSLLSAASDKPQTRIVISTKSATSWMDGELSDKEFEDSWSVEDANQ